MCTANNPMDVKLSDLENEQRNKKLLGLIMETQCLALPVTGSSKDLTHQEHGLFYNFKNAGITMGKRI